MAKKKEEEEEKQEYLRPEGTYFVLYNGAVHFLGPEGIIPIVDPQYVETLKQVTLASQVAMDKEIMMELLHWEIQDCPVGDLTPKLAGWLVDNFDIKLKNKKH